MSGELPVVVSFYGGDAKYGIAAGQLRDDCARLGLDHDIAELPTASSDSWLDICRRKVGFFLQMHRKHRRPILWLDADCRVVRAPSLLAGASCDIAGFLRGYRYLRDFDPLAVPRFFAPFALYFNYTAAATSFLELMDELEREFTGEASDDYFLQEAWLRHSQELAVLALPPKLAGRSWPLEDGQFVYVGISGNVSRFKDQARQHASPQLVPARRKAVLLHEANAALRSGHLEDAVVLYRTALAAGAYDEALAEKTARLIRRQKGTDEAESFLRAYKSAAASPAPLEVDTGNGT